MSIVALRSPLEPLGMNSAGHEKRRSARLSSEINNDHEPPSKRTKVVDNSLAGTLSLKEASSATTHASARRRERKAYDSEVGDFSFSRGSRKGRAKETRPASRTSPRPSSSDAQVLEKADLHSQHVNSDERDLLATANPSGSFEQTPSNGPNGRGTSGTRTSPRRAASSTSRTNTAISPDARRDQTLTVERTRKQSQSSLDQAPKVMKINLPFHDTPVNEKNKKMRKSVGNHHRRTSTGMRGRRASSLIDDGRSNAAINPSPWSPVTYIESHSLEELCENPWEIPVSSVTFAQSIQSHKNAADRSIRATAVPHSEVLTDDFFKHISADLLEPRRMRLLLGWCGDRAMLQRWEPREGPADIEHEAHQTACTIQTELCKDLMSKSVLSDWYTRDASAKIPLIPLRKKANPRNLVNQQKAEELEMELKRLKQEQDEWEGLLSSIPPASTTSLTTHELGGSLSPVHTDLLDQDEQMIYNRLYNSSKLDADGIKMRLTEISGNLEFSVDQFANGIHTLNTTKQTARRIADKTLAQAATMLNDRAKSRDIAINGLTALKALGKVLNLSRLRS